LGGISFYYQPPLHFFEVFFTAPDSIFYHLTQQGFNLSTAVMNQATTFFVYLDYENLQIYLLTEAKKLLGEWQQAELLRQQLTVALQLEKLMTPQLTTITSPANTLGSEQLFGLRQWVTQHLWPMGVSLVKLGGVFLLWGGDFQQINFYVQFTWPLESVTQQGWCQLPGTDPRRWLAASVSVNAPITTNVGLLDSYSKHKFELENSIQFPLWVL